MSEHGIRLGAVRPSLTIAPDPARAPLDPTSAIEAAKDAYRGARLHYIDALGAFGGYYAQVLLRSDRAVTRGTIHGTRAAIQDAINHLTHALADVDRVLDAFDRAKEEK